MTPTSRKLWRFPARLVGGLALPLFLPLMAEAASDQPTDEAPAAIVQPRPTDGTEPPLVPDAVTRPDPPQRGTMSFVEELPATAAPATSATPAADATQAPALGLAECIQIALAQQPAIAAHRASLAAAAAGSRSVDQLRIPTCIVRDLPYRRQQARLGVTVAAAGVDTSEHETVYAVTRLYFSVLYARAQQRVTDRVVNELRDALENATRLLGKEGAPRDLTQNAVDRNRAFLGLAETRQIDAREGLQRALAALREAMGVGKDYCLNVAGDDLPEPNVTVCQADIVALALSRRGEMTQVISASQIAALEIQAQGTSRKLKKETFAAVGDIHARPIPQGTSDGEYRPGAIGLEMPAILAGPRADRVERAEDFSARASSVVDKTRNLITLEAEDTFLKWQQATSKIARARQAADVSDKLARDTLNDFKAAQAVPYRDVLEAVVLAAQARAQFNEARYNQILALAALERVTAGGFSAGLAGWQWLPR